MTVFAPLVHRVVTKTNNTNDLTGLEKFWAPDFVQAVLKVLGYFDIVVSQTAPGDTTKMWYKPDAIPANNAGQTFVYVVGTTTWTPMTEPLFLEWLTRRSGTYNNISYDAPTGRIYLTANPAAGFDLSDLLAYNGTTGVFTFFEKVYNTAPALSLTAPGAARNIVIAPGGSAVDIGPWLTAASNAVTLAKNDTTRNVSVLPSGSAVDLSGWFGVISGNAAHNNGRLIGAYIVHSGVGSLFYNTVNGSGNVKYFSTDPGTNYAFCVVVLQHDVVGESPNPIFVTFPRAQYLSSGLLMPTPGNQINVAFLAFGLN